MKDFEQLPVPRPEIRDERSIPELVAYYKSIKPSIKRRISEFRSIIESSSNDDMLSELCFCVLTANANAAKCHEAIKELCALDLLSGAPAHKIRPKIKGRARFHNKKAVYLVGARELFRKGRAINIVDALDTHDIIATRDALVNDIKGYGYKEASHFLRNIGLGADIAILDRHVLKNLMRYGVIDKMPSSVGSRIVYMEIEDKMRKFSGSVGIPMDELDLLFWSMQTGFIFK